MATVNCSCSTSDDPTAVNIVAYGFGSIVPLGICQSFMAFQNYFAQNTPVVVPSADQTGWVDLLGGIGVTMGA